MQPPKLGKFDQLKAGCFLAPEVSRPHANQNQYGALMRISDDRYSRDRLRLDLALRFMRHEARTHTIRKWTGLSDDRIRKLYREYLERSRSQVSRHRGKSPGQANYFTRTPRVQQESAVLASLYCMLGALPPATEAEVDPPVPG